MFVGCELHSHDLRRIRAERDAAALSRDSLIRAQDAMRAIVAQSREERDQAVSALRDLVAGRPGAQAAAERLLAVFDARLPRE